MSFIGGFWSEKYEVAEYIKEEMYLDLYEKICLSDKEKINYI
jgi:hypothetical protein